jgi:hypothetical protein
LGLNLLIPIFQTTPLSSSLPAATSASDEISSRLFEAGGVNGDGRTGATTDFLTT